MLLTLARIRCALRIGAGLDRGVFHAHAWVEVAGVPIAEGGNAAAGLAAFDASLNHRP